MPSNVLFVYTDFTIIYHADGMNIESWDIGIVVYGFWGHALKTPTFFDHLGDMCVISIVLIALLFPLFIYERAHPIPRMIDTLSCDNNI